MIDERKTITSEQKAAMEKALTNGDRIELIPVKDGIKIMRVQKSALKTGQSARS